MNRKFKGSRNNHGSNAGRKFGSGQRANTNKLTKRLTEEEIGITEYTSIFEGFSGILKFRFSDFQVSEINKKGEIAKLTDTKVPPAPTNLLIEEDEQLLSKYNLEILPMETWDKLDKLSMSPEPTTEIIEMDATEMSKEQRTNIHNAVKNAFANIVGKTENRGDKKLICFQRYRKGVQIDNRVKWLWPGEYVHFIIYKENCDTMEVVSHLAFNLCVRPGMITYAGIKDKRAKTTQWLSIKKMCPQRILDAANRIYGLHVGNFTFADYSISLGMLRGNRFRIALRNVTAPEEVVNRGCEMLKERGFINYYGVQRFGSRLNSPTYLIGLRILQNNFKEAVNHILEEESPSESHGRYSGRSNPAAPMMRALQNSANDFVGALNRLPRNRRLLYVHAYQSLVWNRVATARVRRGLRPLPGDLVLELANADDINEVICENIDEGIAESDDISENSNVDDDKNSKAADVPVKILTEDDIKSGMFTIFDVVLPLPGNTVQYPPNMVQVYEELLAKDGLTIQMNHKMKPYRLSGAYRLLIQKPQDLEWKMVSYDDPRCDLIDSDLDELKGKKCDLGSLGNKYKALLLTFSLPSSSYATMALRELLRADTSASAQAKQNDYYETHQEVESASKRKMDGVQAADIKKPKTEETDNDTAYVA